MDVKVRNCVWHDTSLQTYYTYKFYVQVRKFMLYKSLHFNYVLSSRVDRIQISHSNRIKKEMVLTSLPLH